MRRMMTQDMGDTQNVIVWFFVIYFLPSLSLSFFLILMQLEKILSGCYHQRLLQLSWEQCMYPEKSNSLFI